MVEKTHVVIGNRGRGSQTMWPKSAEPSLHTQEEAEALANKMNAKRSMFDRQPIHWHAKHIEHAHKYVNFGQPAWDGLRKLKDDNGFHESVDESNGEQWHTIVIGDGKNRQNFHHKGSRHSAVQLAHQQELHPFSVRKGKIGKHGAKYTVSHKSKYFNESSFDAEDVNESSVSLWTSKDGAHEAEWDKNHGYRSIVRDASGTRYTRHYNEKLAIAAAKRKAKKSSTNEEHMNEQKNFHQSEIAKMRKQRDRGFDSTGKPIDKNAMNKKIRAYKSYVNGLKIFGKKNTNEEHVDINEKNSPHTAKIKYAYYHQNALKLKRDIDKVDSNKSRSKVEHDLTQSIVGKKGGAHRKKIMHKIKRYDQATVAALAVRRKNQFGEENMVKSYREFIDESRLVTPVDRRRAALVKPTHTKAAFDRMIERGTREGWITHDGQKKKTTLKVIAKESVEPIDEIRYVRPRKQKTGIIPSKMDGKKVTVKYGKAEFGDEDHVGKTGIVKSTIRDHTFSAMVPYATRHYVDFGDGKKHGFKKNQLKVHNESVEPIDELSVGTLKSYVKKARTQGQRAWDKADKEEDKSMSTNGEKYPEKQARHQKAAAAALDVWKKRHDGMNKAYAKMPSVSDPRPNFDKQKVSVKVLATKKPRTVKEDVEQIDELSIGTLKSYHSKAQAHMDALRGELNKGFTKNHFKKFVKRRNGAERATMKVGKKVISQ